MYTNACKLYMPSHSATSQAAALLSISTSNDLCGATELCDTSQTCKKTGSTVKSEFLTSSVSQTKVMGLQGRSVHLEGRCRSACGQGPH